MLKGKKDKIRHLFIIKLILCIYLLVGLSTTAFAKSNIEALGEEAADIASRMRPALPLKSGQSLTIFSVDQSGIVLVYNHTIDVYVPPENYEMLSDWLVSQSYKSACSVGDLRAFVSKGGGLYYRFFINGQMILQEKISSC